MSLSNTEFCKHCFIESHTLNRRHTKFCPHFLLSFLLSFLPCPFWTKIGKSDEHENVLSGCEFRENGRTSSHNLLYGRKLNSIAISESNCPICVQFGIRDLHIMPWMHLWVLGKLDAGNAARFLQAQINLLLGVCRKIVQRSERTEHLDKFCELRHGVYHLQW